MTAFDQIVKNLNKGNSFILEAGAGSGKTYTLIQTLNYLIKNKGHELREDNQKIVCITYTNVAKNEIKNRIDDNELVLISTIHEFLWSSIKQYQKQLRIELCQLNEIRLESDRSQDKDSRYIEGLANRITPSQRVEYNDTSFNDFENGIIQHDDVIDIAKMIFENHPLIGNIIAAKYPYLFVDEYQDTAKETVFCLIDCLLKKNKEKIIIGFFGDSHQKIYNYGIGSMEEYLSSNDPLMKLVKKEENYRSSISVINLLNNFRTNIFQKEQRGINGSVKFVYWANHPEKPKKGIREFNAQIAGEKNIFYDGVVRKLSESGWVFEGNPNSKILVLVNSRVAQRAGFRNLYTTFSRRFGQSTKEKLLDRNHPLVTFFVGSIDKKTSQERKVGLEHLMSFWDDQNHNEIIRFIKKYGTLLNNEFKHSDKKKISELLDQISRERINWSVGDVYEYASNHGLLFDKRLIAFIEKINRSPEYLSSEEKNRQDRDKLLYNSFMDLSYSELQSFWKHIQSNTVFTTKHGTKGDEFQNVLTVIDDTEWPQEFNFKNFFNDTEEDSERQLRTRNLFYVECSRAKDNLVVLCLSNIDESALQNLRNWFGQDNVIDIEFFLA